jgi:hypothetical protein
MRSAPMPARASAWRRLGREPHRVLEVSVVLVAEIVVARVPVQRHADVPLLDRLVIEHREQSRDLRITLDAEQLTDEPLGLGLPDDVGRYGGGQ